VRAGANSLSTWAWATGWRAVPNGAAVRQMRKKPRPSRETALGRGPTPEADGKGWVVHVMASIKWLAVSGWRCVPGQADPTAGPARVGRPIFRRRAHEAGRARIVRSLGEAPCSRESFSAAAGSETSNGPRALAQPSFEAAAPGRRRGPTRARSGSRFGSVTRIPGRWKLEAIGASIRARLLCVGELRWRTGAALSTCDQIRTG